MNTARTLRGLAVLAVASLGFVVAPASAESNVDTSSPYSAVAKLNFQVTIPSFLYFQVGTAGTGVDTVQFTMTGDAAAATIGSGADFSRTNGSVVPVKLITNGGNTNIGAVGTTGGLATGGGATIAWTEIDGTSSNAALGVPAVAGSVAVTATAGIINQSADWTFTYDNTNVPVAGTYNGTVTYTATNP